MVRKRSQGFFLLCVFVWPLRGPWCQLRLSTQWTCRERGLLVRGADKNHFTAVATSINNQHIIWSKCDNPAWEIIPPHPIVRSVYTPLAISFKTTSNRTKVVRNHALNYFFAPQVLGSKLYLQLMCNIFLHEFGLLSTLHSETVLYRLSNRLNVLNAWPHVFNASADWLAGAVWECPSDWG